MLVEYKISLVSLQQNNLLECNSDGFANPRVSLRLSLNYLKPKLTNFSLFLFFSQSVLNQIFIYFLLLQAILSVATILHLSNSFDFIFEKNLNVIKNHDHCLVVHISNLVTLLS
jgi:hypothetical protein